MKRSRIVHFGLATLVVSLVTLIGLNIAGPEQQVESRLSHQFSLDSPQFAREMGVLLGPGIVGGNAVQDLQNGDEIFPSMLDAIASAERTITFETFVYWSGEIGDTFASALASRARAGVEVKVLLDWMGTSDVNGPAIDTLRTAGAQVEFYRPLAWYNLDRINSRTHRKLLVTDGRVGFTGGVGIADEWRGDAQDPQHWRDMHFRVEGPVVAQLQAAFMDNWIETTGEVLNGPDYFPALDSVGEVPAQMFMSSPAGGSDSMRLMYLMAIAAAEHTIDLAAAYFVPDDLMIGALAAAQSRGVRVRILVPGEHNDSELVEISSKSTWGRLLSAGVTISEYTPTMNHTKLLILDSQMVSVGSTNFDIRSFELNDEASLNLYDSTFAAHMTEIFEADFADSRPYTYAKWKARPWREKLAEKLLLPLKSQL